MKKMLLHRHYLFLTLFFLAQLFTFTSFAEMPPLPKGITSEMLKVYSQFNGIPGYVTYAAIIEKVFFLSDGERNVLPGFVIFIYDHKTDTSKLVLENWSLGLILSSAAAGMYSTLRTNQRGSLEIISTNDSIGRNRWEQTLTVAYRQDSFLVVGFNYLSRDTIELENYQVCEYNLLTGKGTRKDRNVMIQRRPFPISDVNDAKDEFLYDCDLW